MAHNRDSFEDLTVEELRQRLIEKRRSERLKRLDHYRRTGRVIMVDAVPGQASLQSFQSEIPAKRKAAQTNPNIWKVWLDRVLLLVEVLAAIGLIYLLFNFFTWLRENNQQAVLALVQPTPSPTALIQAVILPSGHTPPRDGVTRFNEAEIPEHLRPLVQSLANIEVPTPSPEHAQHIKISTINVSAPIVQGDGWEQLKKGVGQHPGTPNPGEPGNLVLSAHNDVFGELFRHLDQLKPGDEILVQTQQKTYTYIVRQTQYVEPTQVEVMAQTREPVVTLISCYPYMVDNQRIVVTADLVEGN